MILITVRVYLIPEIKEDLYIYVSFFRYISKSNNKENVRHKMFVHEMKRLSITR